MLRILASNYTLAAWVNVPSFNFANASLAGSISIFDALGLSGEMGEKRRSAASNVEKTRIFSR